jgi:predicted unusual protein kinase regulating ubiquinone biosynthesis (AarF/ABC1/UbiB family)
VHAARGKDGHEYAVKVQYPGIAEALAGDLASDGFARRLAGGELGKELSSEAIATLRAAILGETDYLAEARALERFGAAWAGDAVVRAPSVNQALSTRRVLTMERMEGMTLDEAADRPVWERKHYAEVLWRFAYKAILMHGTFNADPHPGNYLFRSDGKVVFLDFGCVQPLTPHTLSYARACHHAAREQDEAAFAEHAARLVRAQGGPFEAAFVRHLRGCLEPVFASPFQITSSFVANLFHGMRDLQRTAFQRDSGLTPVPRDTVLLNRLHFGFFSVLARLEVQADYAGEERRFLRV